jgi:hypothetical protein
VHLRSLLAVREVAGPCWGLAIPRLPFARLRNATNFVQNACKVLRLPVATCRHVDLTTYCPSCHSVLGGVDRILRKLKDSWIPEYTRAVCRLAKPVTASDRAVCNMGVFRICLPSHGRPRVCGDGVVFDLVLQRDLIEIWRREYGSRWGLPFRPCLA